MERSSLSKATRDGSGNSFPQASDQTSLFAHEREAIEAIRREVQPNLGRVVSNVNVYDAKTNRYLEIDVVVVAPMGIYVVELKHWSGLIEIKPHTWIQNRSFYKPDPHLSNDLKAKQVKGLFERRFSHFPLPYAESVVVLTNPQASVTNGALPSTTKSCPSFEGLDRFFQYLRHQNGLKRSELTIIQCEMLAEHLESLRAPAHPRDFVYPGYEIVERLVQTAERAEVVARRTEIRCRKLCRLRIFFIPSKGGDAERRVFHERATATLNAVAKVGDHANILKVWAIPDDNGNLVEGSEWSETGTLRDVLENVGTVPVGQTIAITQGILFGLKAIHAECVIHRMLSPANILMINDTPRLMNFDLSFQLEEDRATVIPDSSKLPRTPYVAPEVYEGGISPEATADLFGVGVILFEMLSGKPPFSCSTDLERTQGVLDAASRARLRDLSIPEPLQVLIQELIQSDRNRRPQSADAVLERLSICTKVLAPVVSPNLRLEPDSECGPYRIREFVRAAGQNQLYHARGPRGKDVALKLFDIDTALQQVCDEHAFADAVRHPAIVRVDSYNRYVDGRYYITFDWVSSHSLRDEIDKGQGARGNKRFVQAAEVLLGAMRALHEAPGPDGNVTPILHNDLKPENILLTADDRPVLVDFGSASHPKVTTFEGTPGYVPCDLVFGRDRSYCVEGDLYGLAITLFEWYFGFRPVHDNGCLVKADVEDAPQALLDWFGRATSPRSEERFQTAEEMWKALASTLQSETVLAIVDPEVPFSEHGPVEAAVSTVENTGQDHNPFLDYLNSLHPCSAACENALAESQALNRFFGFLHVPHPLAKNIFDILVGPNRRHVVLTGHAGDGKSTIAVEVYKRLIGQPLEQPLAEPLKGRQAGGLSYPEVVLLKDWSECPNEWEDTLDEMLDPDGSRFLLVSNTGALLESFKRHAEAGGGDPARLETDLLRSIDKTTPDVWHYRGVEFEIINLSMTDNLPLAKEIFRKMVAPERWDACEGMDCRTQCPVRRNVGLIAQNLDTVSDRLFLIYRRLYEYGTRLTLRQLTAHLAYSITSNLTCEKVARLIRGPAHLDPRAFAFFNRVFGSDGSKRDPDTQQLEAVRAIVDHGFGERLSASVEHMLYRRPDGTPFTIKAAASRELLEPLVIAGNKTLSSWEARLQARRMVFFLHQFKPGDPCEKPFFSAFLDSPFVQEFEALQGATMPRLDKRYEAMLLRSILNVLQEHFTGVRRPESNQLDTHLFVTLGRRSADVRPSAQLILARISTDSFTLRVKPIEGAAGNIRATLSLECTHGPRTVALRLDLPFLDYVLARAAGQIGEQLERAYVDRLEQFKGQLLNLVPPSQETNELSLLSLRIDNRNDLNFRRQILQIRDDRIEVIDD